MLRLVIATLALFTGAVFLLNTSRLAPERAGRPLLLAHRGLGQTYSRDGLTAETCTAARLLKPEYPYLENTLEGIRAAFSAGADIVEFDIQPTTDGHFVVFHDWTLDCRTNGSGRTRDHTLAELKALDIAYGYTADGGATYPWRGKGVGPMPTLAEVLDAFPGRRFLVNIKSNDPEEGRQFADFLDTLPQERKADLSVYGGDRPIGILRRRHPSVLVFDTGTVKRCLMRYLAFGWTAIVPDSCRETLFFLPVNIATWTWGFPERLIHRLTSVGTTVVLLGPYDGAGFSSGIDDADTFARIPAGFDGIIWTNRIDRIGPLAKARAWQ